MDEADITEKNIRTIYERERAESQGASAPQKAARHIAEFSGTVWFILFHFVVFSAWISFNVLSQSPFDPYPFIFLTMTVSLESIFLSGFVMLSQNALSKQAERRNALDLHINLLAEQENTATIKFLIKMGKKMGMSTADWKELEALTNDVKPEEVLEKIAKVEEEPGSK